MDKYDVIVIGGGPGGYVAAIRAAQLKAKVLLVEREAVGGICLNWGCIPTKAMLKSAELYSKMNSAEKYGVKASKVSFDIDQIVQHSKDISGQLTGGVAGLLKKNKVTVISGLAKLKSSDTIEVTAKDNSSTRYSAKNIIIATGARARVLKGFEPDVAKNIWTYREALRPKKMPKSMVIVGASAIGLEFASFYNSLGAEVTVLEAMDTILPAEDAEIASIARKSFEKRGIKFHTGIKLLAKNDNSKGVEVSYELGGKEQTISAEVLLMAVGVVANVENLGLESVGVKLHERGFIKTNDKMQTSIRNIYAIGDVTNGPWLAHKASHEGIIAAEVISGQKPHAMNMNQIPGCTYSSPQIASVGLTEAKAKEQKIDVKVGRFPFFANGKALIAGDSEGLVKTIFDAKTGELLGAHMVGCEVTELIGGYVTAMNLETTESELINTIFPHPTLSEMMHEAVLDAYGRTIHM